MRPLSYKRGSASVGAATRKEFLFFFFFFFCSIQRRRERTSAHTVVLAEAEARHHSGPAAVMGCGMASKPGGLSQPRRKKSKQSLAWRQRGSTIGPRARTPAHEHSTLWIQHKRQTAKREITYPWTRASLMNPLRRSRVRSAVFGRASRDSRAVRGKRSKKVSRTTLRRDAASSHVTYTTWMHESRRETNICAQSERAHTYRRTHTHTHT